MVYVAPDTLWWWMGKLRPPYHCCLVGALLSLSTLSLSSSTGHLSCKGIIAIIVWWGPCHLSPISPLPPSSMGLLFCGGLVPIIVIVGPCHIVIIQWGPPPPPPLFQSLLTNLAALSLSLWSGKVLFAIIIVGPHWPSLPSCHCCLGGALALFMSFLSLLLLLVLEQLTIVACGGAICLCGVISTNFWNKWLTYLFFSRGSGC